MQKRYHMSNSFTRQHFLRFGILLALSIVSAVAIVFLGLKRWSTDQYPLVNVGLLASVLLALWAFITFGGALDGKKNARNASLIVAGAGAVVALVVWVVLQIFNLHSALAVLIFVIDLVLVALVLMKTWDILRNFVSSLTNTTDGEGNEVAFPGNYVLENIHINDSLTSPMGTVVIGGNTVMFVLTNHTKGQVLITPDRRIEFWKPKFFSNDQLKEVSLSPTTLMYKAEEGAKRVIRLVEEGCAQRGIPVPAMNYNFCLFMPRFIPQNLVFSEDSFRNFGVTYAISSYKKYVRKASEVDVFCGKAAFSPRDLARMLTISGSLGGEAQGLPDPALVAEILHEACQLAITK